MPESIRRQAEQDLFRAVDRARRVLSACARALALATDEQQFLGDICRITVASGGYSMAWIGFARHDAERSIEAVASAGDSCGYLAKARIAWGDDEFGSGPAGRAVRSGKAQVVQDLHVATDFLPWRAAALGLGHQAVAALPLVCDGACLGVFVIFAAEPHAFGQLEMDLLEGVALNIAFGIQTLRLRDAARRAEAELRAGGQRFQATFDQAPAGIAHVDLAGRITLANQRLERMLGYAPGELVGCVVRELSHPDDIDATVVQRARLLAGEITAFTTQKRYLRKDGSTVWVGLTVSMMRAPGGAGLYDIAVFEDISDRVRAEALLQLEHMVTRDLAESDSALGALRAAIRAICIAEGWDCGRCFVPDEQAGLLRFAGAWGVDDPVVARYLQQSCNVTYSPGVRLMGLVWQSGSPLWMSDVTNDPRVAVGAVARQAGMRGAFLFPLRVAGSVIGVIAFNSRAVREPEPRLLEAIESIGRQIGQFLLRKRAEEAQRRFRIAMDTSPDIIELIDPETLLYIDVNQTACDVHGYTREQMLAVGPPEVTGKRRETFANDFAELIAHGRASRIESRRIRADGSALPVEVLRRAVCLDGRWMIFAIARDTTERVAAEQSLRQSETRFRRLAELSSGGFWETDARHCFTKMVYGQGFNAFLPADAYIGTARWDVPSLSPDAAGWAKLRAIMDAHQRFHEFEFSRADGAGNERSRSISGAPLFDKDGQFTGYQGITSDISARKRDEAELVQLNAELEARVALRTAELERANKELETFSYSVAHDLRAPLRAMTGFSAIVLEENAGKLDAASVRYLQRVKAGGENMGELVDDLLNLARVSRQEMRRRDTNLGEVARKIAAALAEASPARSVEIEIKGHMPAVCDPGLIEIVMSNLIGNAWKFTSKVDAARIEVGVKRRDGKNVYFVRDNGAGFDMAYTKNLFTPFQRLHRREDFEGTGIGLSLVKRIIDKHGGKVWAEGERDKGASFYFTLD